MKSILTVVGFVFFSTTLWAQNFASYSCVDSQASPKVPNNIPLVDFAKSFIDADIETLNPFVKDWVKTQFDRNGDSVVSEDEGDALICGIESSLRLAVPSLKPGSLVTRDGRTSALSYEIGLKQLTGYKMKMAMAIYAKSWLTDQLMTEDAELNTKVRALLAGGGYSVSMPTREEQVDLTGVDRTEFGRMEKLQALAFNVGDSITKFGPEWPKLKPKILQAALNKKSFPYPVMKGKDSVTVAFNTVTPSNFGVDGATRFYVLFGVGLTLNLNKADVWGQPSDQITMILTESKAYPSTSKYVEKLQRKLQKICRSLDPKDLRLAEEGDFNANKLQVRLQNFADQLADAFMEDPVQIEVLEEGLSGADWGHHDVAAGKIQISGRESKEVASKVDLDSQDRFFQFLMVHEIVHYFQSKSEAYEMNHRLYNSPQDANMMFGTHGYSEFYLKQPLEYDAQTLAAEFVECASMDKQAKSL